MRLNLALLLNPITLKKLIFTFFLLTELATSETRAGATANQDDPELIKLRIKELELKKEILELEAKRDNRPSPPLPPAQSYATPEASNFNHLETSRYIRGPRGGCYTYTKSGNKRYVDRSLCN